jgi:2-oxoglutarate ferredoxin oxidoreductase subunit alpha
MAIGAGWAGARALTATSGPGISLMSEFSGLAYFAEIPCVVFDIQRVGPSTGLPTRTSQGDINLLHQNSHGDTKHLVLFPATMEECFEFSSVAFDLAERFQQPVFIASDLDLAMNNWMTDPFNYSDADFDRGKVLTAKDLDELDNFGRYRDVDGDGIPYRTLPGTKHDLAAYLTRGSGHNEDAHYSEKPEDFTYLLDRLARKYETAKDYVPSPIIDYVEDAKFGLIAYGSTDAAIEECRDQIRIEFGTEVSYLRLRSLPLVNEVVEFVSAHEMVFVVEQNRDGQVGDIIRLAVGGDIVKVKSILHYNGLPIDAQSVTDHLIDMAHIKRIT